MVTVNQNYLKLPGSYLFSTVAKKIAAYGAAHSDADIIKMSIGDVTLPLCESVISAMHGAVDEMGKAETFRGYGPEQGYGFLKDAIRDYYAAKGVSLESEEIFISEDSSLTK